MKRTSIILGSVSIISLLSIGTVSALRGIQLQPVNVYGIQLQSASNPTQTTGDGLSLQPPTQTMQMTINGFSLQPPTITITLPTTIDGSSLQPASNL